MNKQINKQRTSEDKRVIKEIFERRKQERNEGTKRKIQKNLCKLEVLRQYCMEAEMGGHRFKKGSVTYMGR